jgi:acyl-CoA reductase-like NAD-dependent aldehyde dehydrogenase
MGPVATPAQRDHVNGLVDDSRKRGAMVHEIGATTAAFDPTAGYYVRPTLVTGLTADAPLVAEEQFGPSVPVLGYSSLDEGVALANDSSMGLASSVWSDDESRAFDVGRRIEAGMTFINCHNRAGMSFRVPFGGVKKSGFGREFGEEGIAEYVQTHALHLPGAVRDAGGEPGKDGRSSGGPRPNEYPT